LPYFIRKTWHIPTTEEYRAMVYGFWSLEEIVDPTKYRFWQFLTKPEYQKRVTEFKLGKRTFVI
jgi:hypothetical protein